jgi:SAM-dependent methyltransferase
LFTKSAHFYDVLYAAIGKDYAGEALRLHELIQTHKRSAGRDLLDLACGTGKHLEVLRQWYDGEGVDLDPGMLAIARERCPEMVFRQANMVDFDPDRSYDIITCLFSSIGYAKTVGRLRQAVLNWSNHLHRGGVLFIEPWLVPEDYREGTVHGAWVDEPDLKICRMNVPRREGSLSILDFHYLVATPEGIDHFTERHTLGLFSHEEYHDAMISAGLNVHFYAQGLSDRGLYVGLKATP